MQHPAPLTFLDATPVDRAVTSDMPMATRGWAPLLRMVSGLAWAVRLPFRIAEVRRDARVLAGLSDRDLSDIGLVRQDVEDAISLPIGTPPRGLLEIRAAERRQARARAMPVLDRKL